MVILKRIIYPDYPTSEENLEENLKIEEMATLRKKRSKLPANLYLDDARTWSKSGHWKRIKFQADKGDSPNTRSMIPMSIDDNPRILIKNPRMNLSAKDIDQIKAFVKLNKDLLLQLSDAKIDIGEFLDKMKLVP
jgi:hypothetical protein